MVDVSNAALPSERRAEGFTHRPSPFGYSFLILLTFFSIYGTYFTFLPTYSSRIIGVIGLFYLVSIIITTNIIRIRINFLIFIFISMTLFTHLLIMTVIYPGDLLILYNRVAFFFQTLPAAAFISYLVSRRNFSFRDMIKLIVICIFLQSIFIIIEFLSQWFRDISAIYIPSTGNIDYSEVQARFRGLTNGGGASLSVIQSIGLLGIIYLIASSKSVRWLDYLSYAAMIGSILISIFLSGRTGILIIPVCIIYILSFSLNTTSIRRFTLLMIVFSPILVYIIYRLLQASYGALGGAELATGEDVLTRLLRWYSEEFVSEDGSLQSRTVQALLSHWFMPDDIPTLLFGDPTTWALNRISSDVGIVRILHATGVIGFLLYYGSFLVIFVYMILSTPDRFSKRYILLISAFLILIETKEPFLIGFNISSIVFIIYFYLLFSPGNDTGPVSRTSMPAADMAPRPGKA